MLAAAAQVLVEVARPHCQLLTGHFHWLLDDHAKRILDGLSADPLDHLLCKILFFIIRAKRFVQRIQYPNLFVAVVANSRVVLIFKKCLLLIKVILALKH